MAKLGRKTKLTPERREVILEALSMGMSIKDTCSLAGITPESFYSWRKTKPDFDKDVAEAKPKHLRRLMEIINFPEEVYRNAMEKYRNGQLTEAALEGIRTTMKLAADNAKWQAARMHGIIEKQYIENVDANKSPYEIMNEAIDSGGKPSEDD